MSDLASMFPASTSGNASSNEDPSMSGNPSSSENPDDGNDDDGDGDEGEWGWLGNLGSDDKRYGFDKSSAKTFRDDMSSPKAEIVLSKGIKLCCVDL
ncbi:hypothetical protein Tco_1437009 [Tanacetum coccineum]